MTTVEEVKKMQLQGIADDQIIQGMREKGVDYREIADALAQSKIKAAVEQPDADPQAYAQNDTMEPSIMSQQPEMAAPAPGAGYQNQAPAYAQQAAPQEYAQPTSYQQDYSQSYGPSSDVTTEIAEQVVAERLGELRKHLEKIADMKTTVESKIEYLDERVKRIERLMDTLQSSVLKKVGDYVTNIEDIKKEMSETQKTFAKLVPGTREAPRPHKQHVPENKKNVSTSSSL